MVKRLAVTVGLALGLVLSFTAPAQAHHNVPDFTIGEIGDCGEVTVSSAWSISPDADDSHDVDNTRLVVRYQGEGSPAQIDAPIGEPITIGPFEQDITVDVRIWGGGERDYDVPPLEDLDALVEHLEQTDDPVGDGLSDGELDLDVPGVAWESFEVEGCPEDDATPTPTATASPTATPTMTESPATGSGGSLPDTGSGSLAAVAGIGGGLVILGGLLLLALRRRQSEQTWTSE